MELKNRLGLSDSILQVTKNILEKKSEKEGVCPHCGKRPCECVVKEEVEQIDEASMPSWMKPGGLRGKIQDQKYPEAPKTPKLDDHKGWTEHFEEHGPIHELTDDDFGDDSPHGKMHSLVHQHLEQHGVPEKHRDKLANGIMDHLQGVKTESRDLNADNAAAARAHDCAKHVVHEQWGEGETITTMHADPDSDGNIAWYDIMFEHGIEREVPTEQLEIVVSETHTHKNMKKKVHEQEQHGSEKKKRKSKDSEIEINPEVKEEIEDLDEARTSHPLKQALLNPNHPIHKHLPSSVDAAEAARTFNYSPGVGHFQKNKAAIEAAHEKASGKGETAPAAAKSDTPPTSEDDPNKHPLMAAKQRIDVGKGTPEDREMVKKAAQGRQPGVAAPTAKPQEKSTGMPGGKWASKVSAARKKSDIKSAASAFLKWKEKQAR